MTDKTKKILAGTGIGLFIAMSALLVWFLGPPLIELVSDPERLRAWVDQSGGWGSVAFVGLVVFQLIIAVIPGEPLEIAAGYVFGAFEGTLLCLAGCLIGSALVFLLVRKFGTKAVEIFFPKKKLTSLNFLKNTKKLNLLVFIVFFIPGTPKDILTYFVGLTKMKFSSWLMISTIARIPSVVTSTIGGDALGLGNFGFAALVFGGTLVLSAMGLLVYRYICKVHGKAAEESE